jgi:hypothetical protein
MRGNADTPFPARSARSRVFVIFLWFAALLHAPLIPTRLFDWLRLALNAGQVEMEELEGETIIPIDFDLMPEAPAAAAPPEPTPAPAPVAAATPAPEGPGPKPELPDAGAPDPPDAAAPVASVDRDAGAPPKPALRDPLAVAGGVGKIASADPNVQVLIASDRIRKHELGAAFGRLLTTIPEWKSFFEGTGIDPIRDLDHVLIAGPQFRDSSKVVAVMDYNLTEARVREAIGVVLDRSDPKGEWLEDTPVPAAAARADRGDRIFAIVPGKRLLAVLPADAKDQLGKLKATPGFNKSSAVGIVISMVTPARAFKNVPFDVPEELKSMKVSVTPTGDGGADVLLELLDGSPELAAEHSKELSAAIEALRKPDLGVFSSLASIELFAPVSFESAGPLIRARTHVTEHQLRRIMTYAESELAKKGGGGGGGGKATNRKRPRLDLRPQDGGAPRPAPPGNAPGKAAEPNQAPEAPSPGGEPY